MLRLVQWTLFTYPCPRSRNHRLLDHERSGFGVRQDVGSNFLRSRSTSYYNLFPQFYQLIAHNVRIISEWIEVVEERTISPWTKGHDFPCPLLLACLACL